MNNAIKLYRGHQWVTKPDADGLSFFGISNYAKSYILRMSKIDIDQFFKTKYGIVNKLAIGVYLSEMQHFKQIGYLTLAHKIRYNRFAIKQDQVFSHLIAVEFDVQLTAPLEMRIIQRNFDSYYYAKIVSEPWLFKIQILKPQQLQQLTSEKEYDSNKKFIPYL